MRSFAGNLPTRIAETYRPRSGTLLFTKILKLTGFQENSKISPYATAI
jgi:hypothetical protein